MNHCGRLILYPHFSEEAQIAPPSVPVRVSPCQQYYKTRDVRQISPACLNCLYTEYSVTPPAGPEKYACPCAFQRTDICAYAKCVSDQYTQNKLCARPYHALFNSDDVEDDQFIPPFTLADIRGCP